MLIKTDQWFPGSKCGFDLEGFSEAGDSHGNSMHKSAYLYNYKRELDDQETKLKQKVNFYASET